MARPLGRRPLALPNVERFDRLFELAPKGTGSVRIPAENYTDTGRRRPAFMTIGPYLSIGPGYESLNVRPLGPVIDAIERGTISVAYDTMSFEIIVWDPLQALVVSSHSKIIGSVWLAVIDPLTIPGWASPRATKILRYARSFRGKDARADAYSVAADVFREEEEDAKAAVLERHAAELRSPSRKPRKKRTQ